MLRLLSIEFHKLQNSKSSKVLSIIYFVLFCFIALFASIRFNFGSVDFRVADQGIFNFPYIWHFNTYFLAFLKLFLAIVIVSMMSSEYTNRTLKQNLIDGLSKKEFILSKFYSILMFALASTILVFLVSLVLGLIFSDYDEVSIIFSEMEYLLAYFMKLVGFFSLCMFFGILLKRSAFALGFLFLLWIVEVIIHGVVKFEVKSMDFILDFLPLQSMSNLIVEPVTKLNTIKAAASQIKPGFEKNYDVPWIGMLIVVMWILIFVYGSYNLLKRRDL